MSYLDGNGLATLWAKIKQYVRDNATSSIPDLSVVTSKIADVAVTTAKLANSAVTTAKIASRAITSDKLATDIFIVEIKTVTSSETIGPNGEWYGTLDVSKSGYVATAIGGYVMNGTNSRQCLPGQIYLQYGSQTLACYIWNQHPSSNAVITLYVPVLYIKT